MEMLDNVKAFFLSIIRFICQNKPEPPAAASTVDIEAVLELPREASSAAAGNQEQSQLLTTFVALQQDLQWQNVILTFCFTSAFEISVPHHHHQQSSQTNRSDIYSSGFLSFAILFTVVLLLVIKLIDGRSTRICQALEKVAILIATAAFFYIVLIPFPVGVKYSIWVVLAISMLIAVVYKSIYGIGYIGCCSWGTCRS